MYFEGDLWQSGLYCNDFLFSHLGGLEHTLEGPAFTLAFWASEP